MRDPTSLSGNPRWRRLARCTRFAGADPTHPADCQRHVQGLPGVPSLCAPQSHKCLFQELIPPTLPIVSVSKGIEVTSGQLMSEVIPSVLGKKQPTVYLSGRRFVRLGWCGVVKFGCPADEWAMAFPRCSARSRWLSTCQLRSAGLAAAAVRHCCMPHLGRRVTRCSCASVRCAAQLQCSACPAPVTWPEVGPRAPCKAPTCVMRCNLQGRSRVPGAHLQTCNLAKRPHVCRVATCRAQLC